MLDKRKPSIFIGSSRESLELAHAVQANLDHDAEITVWDQGVFELSRATMESLHTILSEYDFGIFVFSPDDAAKMRGRDVTTVRDNVILEFGMFAGRLGRERCFMLKPRNTEMHLPSDLLGLTAAEYEPHRADQRLEAAVGKACAQIRKAIQKFGFFSSEEETWKRLRIAQNFPPQPRCGRAFWPVALQVRI